MGASAVQGQHIEAINGITFVFTRFFYNASGDTVSVPVGSIQAAVMPANSNTAPTTSIAQGATNDTVTITGGTTLQNVILVTRHSGGSIAH